MEGNRAQWILDFFRGVERLDRAHLKKHATDDEINELLEAGYICYVAPDPTDFMDDGHYIITSAGINFRAQRQICGTTPRND